MRSSNYLGVLAITEAPRRATQRASSCNFETLYCSKTLILSEPPETHGIERKNDAMIFWVFAVTYTYTYGSHPHSLTSAAILLSHFLLHYIVYNHNSFNYHDHHNCPFTNVYLYSLPPTTWYAHSPCPTNFRQQLTSTPVSPGVSRYFLL